MNETSLSTEAINDTSNFKKIIIMWVLKEL